MKLHKNEVMHAFHSIRSAAELMVKVKVKVNFTLEQATKAQRWSRGIAPLFL
jgi:hypothetical protein